MVKPLKHNSPVILDFDQSIGHVEGATNIPMSEWQEAIRFGCSLETFRSLQKSLDKALPEQYGTVLTGSGDYHHLTWLLVEKLKHLGPFQVVLFDNHPDNMRFPMGIHCGSWVRKVALLPYVSHVHVLGVTSQDISFSSAWEQYWLPLLKGKVSYWCMDVNVSWSNWFGLGKAFHRFENPDQLIEQFIATQLQDSNPSYLTIDKDVLSPDVVSTNWDQGRMLESHLVKVIDALKGNIIGSDITGDVSNWQYKTWWKRKLSMLDGQNEITSSDLALWQKKQQALNSRLLNALAQNSR